MLAYLHQVPRVKTSTPPPPLPSMPSRRAQEQLYLYLYPYGDYVYVAEASWCQARQHGDRSVTSVDRLYCRRRGGEAFT